MLLEIPVGGKNFNFFQNPLLVSVIKTKPNLCKRVKHSTQATNFKVIWVEIKCQRKFEMLKHSLFPLKLDDVVIKGSRSNFH